MIAVELATLRAGDRVIMWDPTADALHTEAVVVRVRGGRVLVRPFDGAGNVEVPAAGRLFKPEPLEDLRVRQQFVIALHIQHHMAMLVCREEQLREDIANEATRAEALVHSAILKTLRELRDRVASGEVMR